MTKSLTEKWKNGKLTFGKMYWCCDKEKNIAKLVYINRKFFEWDITTDVTKDVKEVLAPVPNYEEYKHLQEQLKEANEVIESLRTYDFTVDDENAEYYQVKWNVKAKRFYKNRKWGVK